MLSIPQQVLLNAGQSIPQSCVFIAEDCVQGPVASATADIATFKLEGASAAFTLEDGEQFGVGKLVSDSTTVAALVQNGEPVKLAANKKIIFNARVKLADADGMSYFVGLGITDTDPWTTNFTDYIGFFTTDGNIKAGCGMNNDNVPGSGTTGETDEDTGSDFADDTYVNLQLVVNGTSSVEFYVNGTLTNKITTNLPTDEQLTTIIAQKGDGETTYVDFAYGTMDRV